MDKEFQEKHFVDDESMSDYSNTLSKSEEIQTRIDNGEVDLFDDSDELLDLLSELHCISRILYLAVYYAKKDKNRSKHDCLANFLESCELPVDDDELATEILEILDN